MDKYIPHSLLTEKHLIDIFNDKSTSTNFLVNYFLSSQGILCVDGEILFLLDRIGHKLRLFASVHLRALKLHIIYF